MLFDSLRARESRGKIDIAIAIAFTAIAACGSGSGGDGDGDGDVDAGPVLDIDRERSIVWIDEAIVADKSIIGLAVVMAAVAADGHGGSLLAQWFETFATTAHSERLGPALFVEEIKGSLGADPSAWDLDALPFIVTAVHNRIDLGPRNGACGELRVSLASTHPIYAPLHLIFLFRQPTAEGDVDDEGREHCRATARRWAGLSAMSDAEFVTEAAAIIGAGLVRENFVIAESVELTVSPWEWRQWDVSAAPSNPPMFQTIDTQAINEPGPLRDDFVAFATANAAELTARQLEIPARFRPRSARVPPGVPRVALDLTVDGFDDLAEQIEIVGCPACHTANAEFVHTTPQRTFSDFYDLELDARAAWLSDLSSGADVAVPPFGPLQD